MLFGLLKSRQEKLEEVKKAGASAGKKYQAMLDAEPRPSNNDPIGQMLYDMERNEYPQRRMIQNIDRRLTALTKEWTL